MIVQYELRRFHGQGSARLVSHPDVMPKKHQGRLEAALKKGED